MFPIRDHNPSGRMPFVTLALLAANIVIFLVTYVAADDLALMRIYAEWGSVPARITAGEGYVTLISHMFLHGGWMHLIGNMLFLWIFGDNMEEEFGHLGFFMFYIACGLVAAVVQILPDPSSGVPMVGASGAIAGVMGGYLLLFPKARVDILVFIVIFIRIFTLPAWVVLGIWFAIQLVSALAGGDGGVAYWAHDGGFVAGLLLTLPLWLRRGARRYWARTEGHPPHPDASYPLVKTGIPRVGRR